MKKYFLLLLFSIGTLSTHMQSISEARTTNQNQKDQYESILKAYKEALEETVKSKSCTAIQVTDLTENEITGFIYLIREELSKDPLKPDHATYLVKKEEIFYIIIEILNTDII